MTLLLILALLQNFNPKLIQTELNFYGFEEQRRMSAASKLAGSVNDEDIRLIGQIVDAEPDTAKYTFERID